MRPVDMQLIGKDLAIKWDDGAEGFILLETMRKRCPCAGCQGERDVMGNLYKGPERPLSEASFQIRRMTAVGGYAIQPFWADGHSSGLYSFELLREMALTSS